MIKVVISEEDFSIETELQAISGEGNTGAVASFIGLVRDMVDESLEYMYLECYHEMAHKSLTNIAQQASERWDIHNVVIHHRIGTLTPKDQIVLVIATSRHREHAFNACWFIMDFLKTRAPFWKKERTMTSDTWVSAADKDKSALQRWQDD